MVDDDTDDGQSYWLWQPPAAMSADRARQLRADAEILYGVHAPLDLKVRALAQEHRVSTAAASKRLSDVVSAGISVGPVELFSKVGEHEWTPPPLLTDHEAWQLRLYARCASLVRGPLPVKGRAVARDHHVSAAEAQVRLQRARALGLSVGATEPLSSAPASGWRDTVFLRLTLRRAKRQGLVADDDTCALCANSMWTMSSGGPAKATLRCGQCDDRVQTLAAGRQWVTSGTVKLAVPVAWLVTCVVLAFWVGAGSALGIFLGVPLLLVAAGATVMFVVLTVVAGFSQNFFAGVLTVAFFVAVIAYLGR